MRLISRVTGKIDDWINPIVVKELRQAVQSRFVVLIFAVFLVGQLILVGRSAVNYDVLRGASNQALGIGRETFEWLLDILIVTCLVFIPGYAGVRFMAERNDANVDLLFVTTLKPRAIIWGKWFSAALLALLIFSVCSPFITFTYLLRGIDMRSMIFLLAVTFFVVLATIMLALFLAAIRANLLFRVLGGIGALILIYYIIRGTLSFTSEAIEFGTDFIGFDDSAFWYQMGGLALIILTVAGLLFALSTAMLTPPSANRAPASRIWVVLVWLVSGTVLGITAYEAKLVEPITVWAVGMAIFSCLVILVSACEREHIGPRLRRMIPKRSLLRVPAFLFYSGSAGGLTFAVLMVAATIGVTRFFAEWLPALRLGPSSFDPFEAIKFTLVVSMYTFCYSLLGMQVRRIFFSGRLRPHLTWVLVAILVGLIGTLPYITVSVIELVMPHDHYRNPQDVEKWLLPNPFTAAYSTMEHSSMADTYLLVAIFWTAVMVVLNMRWFAGRVTDFFAPKTPPPRGELVGG
jgi:hypothetical protein